MCMCTVLVLVCSVCTCLQCVYIATLLVCLPLSESSEEMDSDTNQKERYRLGELKRTLSIEEKTDPKTGTM